MLKEIPDKLCKDHGLELTCAATILECVKAMSTTITLLSSHSWYTVTLPLMIAVLGDRAKLTAVAGNAAKPSKQAIIPVLLDKKSIDLSYVS